MIVVSQYESDPRVRREAEALVSRGDEVTVLALYTEGQPRDTVVDGVKVVHLPVRKYRGDSTKEYLSLYGGFSARAMAWLTRNLRTFDVVQAHSMPEALVFAALPSKLAGVPVLLDVHDRTPKLFASKFDDSSKALQAVYASEKWSLRFATETITVTDLYADDLQKLTKKKVSVVMNCPDERLFRHRDWKGWDPAENVIFSYHGLIAARHGLIESTEALREVRRSVPGAKLQIRGGGDGLDPLRARVKELGMEDVVDLPERLYPITEIPGELDRVHIGLVPSRVDSWTEELMPTKLLEYAAIGIPVITFRNPVIERYFPEDSVTYVHPASPENLRDAMLKLATDPEGARRQAERATEVMATLNWSHQKKIYFDVIDRLARRGRG